MTCAPTATRTRDLRLGGRLIVGSQPRLSWSVAVCLVRGIRSVSLVFAEFGHAKGTGVGPRRPGARRRWAMSHTTCVFHVSGISMYLVTGRLAWRAMSGVSRRPPLFSGSR
jgi:hypothetical protein